MSSEKAVTPKELSEEREVHPTVRLTDQNLSSEEEDGECPSKSS